MQDNRQKKGPDDIAKHHPIQEFRKAKQTRMFNPSKS